MSTTVRHHADATSRPDAAEVDTRAHLPAARRQVLEILDRALATELVCTLRYRRHHALARGLTARPAAAEFAEHARQELEHAERIAQLGGEPDFEPGGLLARSHARYDDGGTLREMIVADLEAERLAIESYRAAIREIGDDDPTTRRLLEEILAVEEEHADDLANLIGNGDDAAAA